MRICIRSKIRLYDPGSQRRPVINLRIEDQALTTLATAPKEKYVLESACCVVICQLTHVR